MDKDLLYSEINEHIENDNFQKVVSLWEGFDDKKLDFNNEKDKAICDAISTSYLKIGLFEPALTYIDSRVNFMKTSSGSTDRTENNYSNWDWYFSMKSNLLFEPKQFLQLYKLTLDYKKYGGCNPLYLSILRLVEDEYYLKYFKSILKKVAYFLSIIVPLMIIVGVVFRNKYTASVYYDIAICLGIIILILYLYFKVVLQKITSKLFRLFIRVSGFGGVKQKILILD